MVNTSALESRGRGFKSRSRQFLEFHLCSFIYFFHWFQFICVMYIYTYIYMTFMTHKIYIHGFVNFSWVLKRTGKEFHGNFVT